MVWLFLSALNLNIQILKLVKFGLEPSNPFLCMRLSLKFLNYFFKPFDSLLPLELFNLKFLGVVGRIIVINGWRGFEKFSQLIVLIVIVYLLVLFIFSWSFISIILLLIMGRFSLFCSLGFMRSFFIGIQVNSIISSSLFFFLLFFILIKII